MFMLNVFNLAINYLVPAVVWSILAVGLFQFVRQSIQHATPRAARKHGQRAG